MLYLDKVQKAYNYETDAPKYSIGKVTFLTLNFEYVLKPNNFVVCSRNNMGNTSPATCIPQV